MVAYPGLRAGWDEPDARSRLLDATVELAAHSGLGMVTVGTITDAAGVTRRTFYRYFADVPGAFLTASFGLHADLRQAVDRAYATTDEPEQRALACIDALVAFVREDPVRAEVLFVEGPAGGVAIDAVRTETKQWAIGLLMGWPPWPCRPPSVIPDGDPMHHLLAEMAVGGIHAVIWRQLVRGQLDTLADATPCLVETALRPYRWSTQRLGPESEVPYPFPAPDRT